MAKISLPVGMCWCEELGFVDSSGLPAFLILLDTIGSVGPLGLLGSLGPMVGGFSV